VITTFIKPTLVKGYSMYPTIEPDNYLIVNRLPYIIGEPARGDILVFKANIHSATGEEKDLIKRVVGIAGDEIEIINGAVYRNDKRLKEGYLIPETFSGHMEKIKVQEGYLFVMGDNRPDSLDSRDPAIGMVQVSDVLGRADLRLYPLNEMGILNKVKE
ncbi:MAG: signal peptidase I, partial [Anaerovorax sp.]